MAENSSPAATEVHLVCGRSGAGKSSVMQICEDLGYFYIDNLPLSVLAYTLEKLEHDRLYQKLIIGIDSRSFLHEKGAYAELLEQLRQGTGQVQMWYLDADTRALELRFNETRRKHPYSHYGHSLNKALQLEREQLQVFADSATRVIDTTHLNIAQLRAIVKKYIQSEQVTPLQVNLFSFGYKYGMPNQVDYVFDVRCLPNPYWTPELRPLSGRDQKVREFFDAKPEVVEMVDDIGHFVQKRFEQFKHLDRSYLNVGIGCTGGQHRSVYVAEALYQRIINAEGARTRGYNISIEHREASKW